MITIEIPAVQGCAVTECAYNSGSECHAKAITIGDSLHPGCDTYMDGNSGHTGNGDVAGVGACKVTGCAYNDDLECGAQGVSVGLQSGMATCMTYSPG
jgi:hypothetical protein